MKTAMILAAGRGERLRPLTDLIPKPLFKVDNIPVIESLVCKLAQAGFQRIVINHSWLGGQIRQHLGNGVKWDLEICYSPEPPGALETGGGIVNAKYLLGKEPFVTVNADLLTDYDFAGFNLPKNSLVHLLLINKPKYFIHGDFGLSTANLLNNNREYTFAGIAYYRPEVFDNHRPGRFSVLPILRKLAENALATGEIYQGKWIDIAQLP
jgi:MurNAc alpha-1-phosphate uridylyltransferase